MNLPHPFGIHRIAKSLKFREWLWDDPSFETSDDLTMGRWVRCCHQETDMVSSKVTPARELSCLCQPRHFVAGFREPFCSLPKFHLCEVSQQLLTRPVDQLSCLVTCPLHKSAVMKVDWVTFVCLSAQSHLVPCCSLVNFAFQIITFEDPDCVWTHDHIIGCTVTPLRPRTSRFSVINVCTKSEIKLPAYWKHSVSLLSDRQNITQAAPGFFLDWRGTSDKQHAGPTMGHQNDENTQQTSRKAASRCRHWRNCFAFGDTDNCGEALTFWWDASRPRGMHFSSKCLSKKKIIIFLSLSRGKGLQPQVWSFEINWMMHGVVIRLWISMKAQCDTAYTCSVLM